MDVVTRIPVRLILMPLLQHHCCWRLLWRQQRPRGRGVGQGSERPLNRAAQLNRQRHRLWCCGSTSTSTSGTSAVAMCGGSSRSCWRLSCQLLGAAAACW